MKDESEDERFHQDWWLQETGWSRGRAPDVPVAMYRVFFSRKTGKVIEARDMNIPYDPVRRDEIEARFQPPPWKRIE